MTDLEKRLTERLRRRDAEIERLEGRESDASFLIGYLTGDTPVGRDAAKWFRGEAVLDRDAG